MQNFDAAFGAMSKFCIALHFGPAVSHPPSSWNRPITAERHAAKRRRSAPLRQLGERPQYESCLMHLLD